MDLVRSYHECSKHHLERYAPGPGGLDWNSQPDPFRRYAGAQILELPLLADDLPVCWDELFGAAGASPCARTGGGNVFQVVSPTCRCIFWQRSIRGSSQPLLHVIRILLPMIKREVLE